MEGGGGIGRGVRGGGYGQDKDCTAPMAGSELLWPQFIVVT